MRYARVQGAVFAVVLVALLIALMSAGAHGATPTSGRPADVPTFRGDPARTGLMPVPGPAGPVAVPWPFHAHGSNGSSPVVVRGTVYVGSEAGFRSAVDGATGVERSRLALGGAVASSPAVTGDVIDVGSGDVSPVAGSSASPEATAAAERIVPGPEECRVTPRDQAALAAVVATPDAARAVTLPERVATEAELPRGGPVDAATVAAITAVVRELVACANAGDSARALALLSDGYLRRAVAGSDSSGAEALVALASAAPAPRSPEKRVALVAVRDARTLPDGRVGLVVIADDSGSAAGAEAAFFVFVPVGDQWRLDGLTEILAAGAAGTEQQLLVPVRVDEWVITVTGTDVLRSFEEVNDREVAAQGVFVVVYLSLHNASGTATAFPFERLQLVDGQGRVFPMDSKATERSNALASGRALTDTIAPETAAQMQVLFDVPTDASGLVLTMDQAPGIVIRLDR